jgi:hypothetical protein
MFTLIGRAYISGVTKKLSGLLNKNFFIPEEHRIAEQTVCKLYSCRLVDSIFYEVGVKKLQKMAETDDLRGMLKLARDKSLLSDKPWCVSYVISALNSCTTCLPDIVYQATTAYLYGEL